VHPRNTAHQAKLLCKRCRQCGRRRRSSSNWRGRGDVVADSRPVRHLDFTGWVDGAGLIARTSLKVRLRVLKSDIKLLLRIMHLGQCQWHWQPKFSTNGATLSSMNLSGYVAHVTIISSWMFTIACCLCCLVVGFLVRGLWLGLDLVRGWLVVMVMNTYLYYFRFSLWHCHVKSAAVDSAAMQSTAGRNVVGQAVWTISSF